MHTVFKIFTIILMIFSIICSIIIFTPLAFGLKSYKITSSSMKPVLNKGDLIYVKKASFESLNKNDIITFYLGESNAIVTHRISRIDQANKLIYTKGDMNKSEDGQPVSFENIIGRYTDYKIPNIFGF